MAPKRSESSQSGKMKEPLMKLSEKFPAVPTKELTKALSDAKNDVAAAEEVLKKAGHKPGGTKAPGSKRSSSPAGSKKSATPASQASSPSKKSSKSKAGSPAPSAPKNPSSKSTKSSQPQAPSPPPPPEPTPTPTPVEETEEEKEQKLAIKKLVLETNRSVEACGDALRLSKWDLEKAQALLEIGDKMDHETSVIKLRRFFARYKPSASSIEETEKFLKTWHGAEDKMWQILVETYGEPPDDTEADVLLANQASAASQRSGFPEALQGSPQAPSPAEQESPLLSTGLPPPPIRQGATPSPSFPSQPQMMQHEPPPRQPSGNYLAPGVEAYGTSSPSPSFEAPGVSQFDSTLQPPEYAQHAAWQQQQHSQQPQHPQQPQHYDHTVPVPGAAFPGAHSMGVPGMPGAIPGMPVPGMSMPGMPMPGMPMGPAGEIPPWMSMGMQAPWLPGMYQPPPRSQTTESESTVYEEEHPKPSVQRRKSSQSPVKPSAFARPVPDRSTEMEQMILDKIKGIEDALQAVSATPKPAQGNEVAKSEASPVPVADLPPPPPPPPPLPETPALTALPDPAKQLLQETQAIQARTRAAAQLARKLRKEHPTHTTHPVQTTLPVQPEEMSVSGPPPAYRTEPGAALLYGMPDDMDLEPVAPFNALGGALSSVAGIPQTDMADNYQLLLSKQQELLSRSQDQGDKIKIRALEKELTQMQQRFSDTQRHQAEQLEVISSIQKQIETDSRLTRGSINHLEDLTEGVQSWAARMYQQQQDYLDTKTQSLKMEALEHQEKLANMHLNKPEDIVQLAQQQEEIMHKTKSLADQRAQLLSDPLRQTDVYSEMADIDTSLRESQARQKQYENTLNNLTDMMASGMLTLGSTRRHEEVPPPPPPGPPPPLPSHSYYEEPSPPPAVPPPPPPEQYMHAPVIHAPVPVPAPPPPPIPVAAPVPAAAVPSHPPPGSMYQLLRDHSLPAPSPAPAEVMHELGTVKEVLKLLVKHQVEQSSQQEEVAKSHEALRQQQGLDELHDARMRSAMIESAVEAQKEKERGREREKEREREREHTLRPSTPSRKTRRIESPRPSPRRRSSSKTSSPSRRAAEEALHLTAVPRSPRSTNIQQSLLNISEAVQHLKSGGYRNSSTTPSHTPAPTVTTLPASPASHAKEHRALPPPENPHRAVLVQFYKKQDPSKLKDIDTILERFEGHDNTLFHSLSKKYNVKCSPYRDRLIAFYSKYNPSKLCEVDIILHLVEGSEEKFLRKLEAKYIRNEQM